MNTCTSRSKLLCFPMGVMHCELTLKDAGQVRSQCKSNRCWSMTWLQPMLVEVANTNTRATRSSNFQANTLQHLYNTNRVQSDAELATTIHPCLHQATSGWDCTGNKQVKLEWLLDPKPFGNGSEKEELKTQCSPTQNPDPKPTTQNTGGYGLCLVGSAQRQLPDPRPTNCGLIDDKHFDSTCRGQARGRQQATPTQTMGIRQGQHWEPDRGSTACSPRSGWLRWGDLRDHLFREEAQAWSEAAHGAAAPWWHLGDLQAR